MNTSDTSLEILSLVLQANEQVVDKYDSLIGTMSLLATVFGVIVAIALAYSAYERYKVDKEIRQHKEGIKRVEKEAQKSARGIKSLSEQTTKWADDAKKKIEEKLQSPLVSKEDLKALEKEVDEIREAAAYAKGAVSTSPTLDARAEGLYFFNGTVPSSYSPVITCEKCGVQYKVKFDLNTTPYAFQYNALVSTQSKCPVCHHTKDNEFDYPLHTL